MTTFSVPIQANSVNNYNLESDSDDSDYSDDEISESEIDIDEATDSESETETESDDETEEEYIIPNTPSLMRRHSNEEIENISHIEIPSSALLLTREQSSDYSPIPLRREQPEDYYTPPNLLRRERPSDYIHVPNNSIDNRRFLQRTTTVRRLNFN